MESLLRKNKAEFTLKSKGKTTRNGRYRCINCSKIFSRELDWQKHESLMSTCGKVCKCDVFLNGKYSHTIGKEIIEPEKRIMEIKEIEKLEA